LAGLTIVDESCNGNDGSITGIVATGSNITFEWNGNTSSSEDLTNASGGFYTLVVEDDAGCTASAGPFEIEVALGPTVDDANITITDESCFGNDASIEGIIATGTNLTYEWNGNTTPSADLQNATNGSYTLVVTDDQGCSTQVGPYTINQDPGPSIDESNLVIEDEVCQQGNGSINGIVASGIALSYEWNGNPSVNEDINGVAAGSYTLVVTDNDGCQVSSGPHTVSNIPGPQIDLTNLEIINESCEGGNGAIIGISATGGGLTYTWNASDVTPTPDYTGLNEGSYGLVVEDTNGCQAVAGPFEIIFIPGPTIDDANLNVTDETCLGNDGAIEGLSATGTDLVYIWNGDTLSSIDLLDLSIGDYTLEVLDGEGCSESYGPISVGGVSPSDVSVSPVDTTITAGDNVDISVTVDPGQSGASIDWSPTNGLSCNDCFSPNASPNETITYNALVIDENGCESAIEVRVEVEDLCGEPFVPTIFSPNNDGNNDFLCVLGDCISEISFVVYNRWGEKVFYTEDPTECWDGTYQGQPLNTGIYVFKAIGLRTDGGEIDISGNLTLVR
jgi:gliding motility-associated-like protein